MTPPDPSLDELISSLTKLKKLADGLGLNDIGDLIGLALAAAQNCSEKEVETS